MPFVAVHVTRPSLKLTEWRLRIVESHQEGVNSIVSRALGRQVSLAAVAPEKPHLEEYWPDLEDLDHRDTVTDEAMAAGTFFDAAPVHLLTTATLNALRKSNPESRFSL